MRLLVERADLFLADFEEQFAWYAVNANWDVAQRFKLLVHATIEFLALRPAMGRARRFRHRELAGIRSHGVLRPFHRTSRLPSL